MFCRKREKLYLNTIGEQANLLGSYKVKNERNDKLIKALNEALNLGYKIAAYDYSKKKNEYDKRKLFYVLIKDERKFVYTGGGFHISGCIDFIVIGEEAIPGNLKWKFNDVPYMQTKFDQQSVTIYELHTDVCDEYYQNRGYGTAMVNALIDVARQSGCNKISGSLSAIDAETEEKKESRNIFYRKRGFELKFTDDSEKSGSLFMVL